MTKTFCPLPWTHLATRANGDLRVCCQANQGPNLGLLKDEAGTTYNLNTHSMRQARNASLVKDIRSSMLKGEKHPECVRCWTEESFNLRSKRLQTLEYCDNYEEAASITQDDGTVPDDLPYSDFDLRLGNLCNLKCRICAPSDSSMWYEDFHALTGKTFDDTGFHWYRNELVWKDLERQLPKIERFFIIGGEPTLIQKHFEFLELCVEKGYAPQIFLEYTTNVTNIHQKFLDIWKNFKGVHIGCSVDGVGAVNDYVRFPSKWRAIEKNLAKLAEFEKVNGRTDPSEDKKINVVLATTVCVYNVYYLDELIKWNMQNHNFVISMHPLYKSEQFSVKILPRYAKEAIAAKLRSSYDWMRSYEAEHLTNSSYDKSAAKLIKDVEGYIEFMMDGDMTDQLHDFWADTSRLDEIRGENIERSLPELFDLIKDTEFETL